MSTELDTKPIAVINPATAEVLTLDSPTEDLGHWLADVREHESLLRETKRAVTAELLTRFDHDVKWTTYVGNLKLSTQSPAPVAEWDGLELRSALLGFVDDGTLSIEAVEAAVETITTYKARKAGVNALLKLGGRVSETVESLRQEREQDRRITVTRA